MIASIRSSWARYGIPRHAQPWLVYLGALAFQPIFEPGPAVAEWAWVVGLIVVFLPIYAWTTRAVERRPFLWRRGPGSLVGLIMLCALGIVGSSVNAGSTVFLVFAASLAGRLHPRSTAVSWVVVAALSVVAAGLLSTIPAAYRLVAFGPVAVLTPILGMASLFEAERTRSAARLGMAQDEIERLAAATERERIARDLHDLLGHSLSTITLKSELAGRLAAEDPARSALEIADVERISREALADVRAAVRGYHGEGLQREIANARLALDAADVDLDYFLTDAPFRPQAEAVLTFALREAITNVVRHAGAKRCRVTLEREGDWLLLAVDDDGVGRSSEMDDGSGLTVMRERVRPLGGRVSVDASRLASSRGTRLEVAVPWSRVRLDGATA